MSGVQHTCNKGQQLPACLGCGRTARDGVRLIQWRPLTSPVGTVVHLCADEHAQDCMAITRARSTGAVGTVRHHEPASAIPPA